MKRTDKKICCGTQNGFPVYRVVVTDGKNYYVKWKNDLINVNEDIINRRYSYR